MKNGYFFGIDGGGTNSRLAITDSQGKVLCGSTAGSTNIYSVSKDEVRSNLSRLLDSALISIGLQKTDLQAGCLGSAGLGREIEQKIYREFFDSLIKPDFLLKLCTDGETLLCGGLQDLEGYCLIAGTGSIAQGRSRDGRLVRSGGHGYMLGDEGSSAWIGRTAIARSLRSLENRDLSTEMMPLILKAAGLEKAGDLVKYVHHDADKAVIGALAPTVALSARNGDPLALDILNSGARELALLVKSVLERSPWIEHKALVLAGGVIENNDILAEKLKDILSRENPELSVGLPKGTALEGACLLAINLME